MRNLILFFSFAFVLLSCNHSKVVTTESSNGEYDVLLVSEFGGSGSDEIQILNSKQEFYTLWEELMGQSADEAPSFDVDEEMIIVKSFKSNRTGGSEYEVRELIQKNNTIKIYYSVDSPSEIATQVITNPVIIIKSQKINNPNIEFILQID